MLLGEPDLDFVWDEGFWVDDLGHVDGTASNSDIRFAVHLTHNDETKQTWLTAGHVDHVTGQPSGNTMEIYKSAEESGSVTIFHAATSETSVFSFTQTEGLDVATMACTMFFRGIWASGSQ